jgi:hypothetical protein
MAWDANSCTKTGRLACGRLVAESLMTGSWQCRVIL